MADLNCDLLHIGMPRCGSSFLQAHVFPKHPDILLARSQPINRLFRQMLDYEYTCDPQQIHHALAEHVQALRQNTDDTRRVVFSWEGFCGDMYSGLGRRHVADLCAQVFGKTRVLLVLREQYALLYSIWNHYVAEGGTMRLKRFLSERPSPGRFHRPSSLFTRVQYDAHTAHLFDLFGKDNVTVLFMEDLQKNPDDFLQAVYRAAGARTDFPLPAAEKKVNRSYGHLTMNVFRTMNALTRTPHNSAPLLPFTLFDRSGRNRFDKYVNRYDFLSVGKKPDIRPLIPADAQQSIRESNSRLAALLNLDLKSMGYDTLDD